MDYFKRFNFLFAAPVFDADDLEGLRFNQITTEIERSGFEVVRARKLEDAEIAVQTDAAIGCMVVDWGKKGLEGKTAALINLMRRRGLDFPIILLIRRKRFEDLPVEVLDFIDGYVFLSEETPPFIAKNLISRLKQYAETLKTPFFGALVDYAEEGNQLWTCPGHNGGVFYSRSPIGRVFVEHLGEAVFRDDLDNSILNLGDLPRFGASVAMRFTCSSFRNAAVVLAPSGVLSVPEQVLTSDMVMNTDVGAAQCRPSSA